MHPLFATRWAKNYLSQRKNNSEDELVRVICRMESGLTREQSAAVVAEIGRLLAEERNQANGTGVT